MKYYAVRIGKVPGIYTTWEECKDMVDGFPGAIYKSFQTPEQAAAFLGEAALESGKAHRNDMEQMPECYAFVDGSYNEASGVYGYGGFLVIKEEQFILQGSGSDPQMASMRNVAGEIMGSCAAIKRAVELGQPQLTVYYDYLGIEMWATGNWKRNKKGTAEYYEYVQSVRDKISLQFVKVKGHSGVEGNEKADRLAKEAVGIG